MFVSTAYAADPARKRSAISHHPFGSDLTYYMQSGAGAQDSNWFDAYSWTWASREVGPGALQCTVRIYDNYAVEISWAWDKNRERYWAGRVLEVHTNHYRDYYTDYYMSHASHEIRNPFTLTTEIHPTYVTDRFI